MAVTRINYGDIASSEILNNNFDALTGEISRLDESIRRIGANNGYDDTAIINRLDSIYLKTSTGESGIVKTISNDLKTLSDYANSKEYTITETYTSTIGSNNVQGADSNRFKYFYIENSKNSVDELNYNQHNYYWVRKHYKPIFKTVNGTVTRKNKLVMLEQGGTVNILIKRAKSVASTIKLNFKEPFTNDEYEFKYGQYCPKYPAVVAQNGFVLTLLKNNGYNENPYNTSKKYVQDKFSNYVNFAVAKNGDAIKTHWEGLTWEAYQRYDDSWEG